MSVIEKPNVLTASVVRVGDGRGFVVEHRGKRLVLTAAHCLPRDEDGNVIMPPPHPWSYLPERTYPKLLGLLGAEPTFWAECLFVNPVADIARRRRRPRAFRRVRRLRGVRRAHQATDDCRCTEDGP
jgi:hypothetical protein